MKKIILLFLISIIFLISILFAQEEKSVISNEQIEITCKKELVEFKTPQDFYAVSKGKMIAVVNNSSSGYGDKTIKIIVDGMVVKRIEEKNCKLFDLKFSSDGEWLSYGKRVRDGVAKIKLYNLNDNNTTTIEFVDNDCGYLDFSPDGKKIVYSRYLEKGKTRNMEIVINDFAGTETIITKNANFPKWSPTGDKIAISKVEPASNSKRWIGYIWIYDLHKKEETKLNNSQGMASATMCWSPDGSKISVHNGKNLGILDVLSDRRVDVGEFDARSPSWSPDGSKLLFTQPIYKDYASGIISDLEIFIVNSDGTSLLNLTNTKDILEDNPNWLGKNEVIMKSEKDGLTKLYLSKIDN